ncbi:hypothetical protein MLD38_023999 [Melastoma candidum]|uniref:Uncharacterized protein n=1 Tax=Melastoma candidum TaxID=119954 RepID=A0ACB9NUB8_9MYRT|nr:hypothetical protein MLD38_023999 [Melastoma candidum]
MKDNFLPPGFRFHPTDEELITHYLSRKVLDAGFSAKAVADVDLNKCEPWDLPAKASMGEKEWYFFSLRDRKYPTGLRTNRATEAGYWKTTGKDKEILRSGILVGMKKTLVFYRGRAPRGQKTNWVMHEYRLESKHSIRHSKEEWVICRVFEKTNVVKKSQPMPSDEQSPDSPCQTNSALHDQIGDLEHMPNLIDGNPNMPPVGFTNNIPTQIHTSQDNHPQALFPSSDLSWTSYIRDQAAAISPLLTSRLAVNSFLLKALQMKTYHPQLPSGNEYPLIPNAIIPNPQFGGQHLEVLNFRYGLFPSSSSDVNLEQQQQQLLQQEEQPFSWTPFSEDM